MLVFKRILSVILFLPFFILHLLFRYIGILTLLTSGITTTLLLIIARVLAFLFLITPIVILAFIWITCSAFSLSSCLE